MRSRQRMHVRHNNPVVSGKCIPSCGCGVSNFQVSIATFCFYSKGTFLFSSINQIYFYYNTIFTIIHFVSVCMYAAWVHEESLRPLAPLSAISVKHICHEVSITIPSNCFSYTFGFSCHIQVTFWG